MGWLEGSDDVCNCGNWKKKDSLYCEDCDPSQYRDKKFGGVDRKNVRPQYDWSKIDPENFDAEVMMDVDLRGDFWLDAASFYRFNPYYGYIEYYSVDEQGEHQEHILTYKNFLFAMKLFEKKMGR